MNDIASSVYVSVDGEIIAIDPKHLYQTLLVVGINTIDPQTFSAHTLFLHHLSFDTKILMRLHIRLTC